MPLDLFEQPATRVFQQPARLATRGLRSRGLGLAIRQRHWIRADLARPRRLPIHGEYRQEFPGAIYHLTGRGNARQKIFFSDNDSPLFLDILAGVVDRYNYHLLVENPRGLVSLLACAS